MGNWKLQAWQEPKTLTRDVLRDMRRGRPAGLSRRTLIRRSIGAAVSLWVLEVTAGSLGFLWPNLAGGFGSKIELGNLDAVAASNAVNGATIKDGAPSYFFGARTYVQLIDASRGFVDGTSDDGEGLNTNVRTLYQRCPHLGCKPNFCTINYWFECPCHGSRYDRLGQKIAGLGPAPRSLDRFAHTVSGGVLTVNTGKINLGPLPLVLGDPGLVPPRSATGCI